MLRYILFIIACRSYLYLEITNMVFLLLFLIISIKHGIADIYDIVPDEYINYYRNNDKYTEGDTDVIVDKIKYNQLLSLLHNEYSNKVLLAQISNPVKNSESLRGDNTTDKVNVTNNHEFKDNTRKAIEDWNRLKREYNITDNAILKDDWNDISKLTSESNRLKRDNEAVVKVKVKSDKDFKDNITGLVTKDQNILNKKKKIRPKRHTALKLLRDLIHHTTIPPPRNISVLPNFLRQSHDETVNSTFNDLIENWTESINVLNGHLANLKLHVKENLGFVMIKVPISELDGKRYLNGIYGGKNQTRPFRSSHHNLRPRRDVTAVNSDETSTNSTLDEDTIHFNVTENGKSIIDPKENIEPTIISDLETIKILNDVNKSKRDANITNTELNNFSSNDSLVNDTEKSDDNILYSKLSDINEKFIETTGKETNNSKTSQTELLNNMYNKVVKRENTRKYLGNRDDLLFSIEKVYSDIKNLITPMDDIRDKYSPTTLYKIGYIIANLDTMDVTFKKLKNKMFKNAWDTKRLRKVYKKLNLSKKLLKHVMQYLDKYARNQ